MGTRNVVRQRYPGQTAGRQVAGSVGTTIDASPLEKPFESGLRGGTGHLRVIVRVQAMHKVARKMGCHQWLIHKTAGGDTTCLSQAQW